MSTVRRRHTAAAPSTTGNVTSVSTTDESPDETEGKISDVSLFGVRSDDATAFMLLLVPFILTWTIGYLGFSSFFAFLVAISVYWGIFTKNQYIRKHAWLSELIGTCLTGENAALEEKQRLYRQCKLASIPMHQVPGHLMHNDQQRAEWLNVVISQMWPFISDFIKRILRETVEPQIKTLLPQMKIQFTQISLGEKAPRIVAIKVYERKDGDARDRIELDCQLAWVSDACFKLKVMASTAEIEKLQFFGKMRISLEPLLSEPPLIGAMSLTFLLHPDVEYQLNGLAAVANAPGVKSAVQRAVNDAIATYLVMPNRIDIPIATLETNALHFRLPEGVVRISVIQARNLHNMDSGLLFQGKSDPYARVKVGSEEHKTPVIDSDLNPDWVSKCSNVCDYTFDFPVHDVSQQITVELWDEDNDADDFLGSVKIDVCEVANEFYRFRELHAKIESGELSADDEEVTSTRGYTEQWYKLSGKNIKHGEVKLRINWLVFTTEQVERKSTNGLNQYFLGIFLNSVMHLPNYLRGRQIYVELALADSLNLNHDPDAIQRQQSHTSVAPDCSLAETKWFFTTNIDSITLHYTVNQASSDRAIARYKFKSDDFDALVSGPTEVDGVPCPTRWRKTIQVELDDGKDGRTQLRSTIAVRQLDGHKKAFEKPISEPKAHHNDHKNHLDKIVHKSKPGSKRPSSVGDISITPPTVNGSLMTLNNLSEDFDQDKNELTVVTLTWRYSQNSEIVTVVIHGVGPDFPEGAKVKCKCGKRTADSKHHPNIIENKIEIKKCDLDSSYRIDVLIRKNGKTLGRGTVDMFNDGKQQVQIYA